MERGKTRRKKGRSEETESRAGGSGLGPISPTLKTSTPTPEEGGSLSLPTSLSWSLSVPFSVSLCLALSLFYPRHSSLYSLCRPVSLCRALSVPLCLSESLSVWSVAGVRLCVFVCVPCSRPVPTCRRGGGGPVRSGPPRSGSCYPGTVPRPPRSVDPSGHPTRCLLPAGVADDPTPSTWRTPGPGAGGGSLRGRGDRREGPQRWMRVGRKRRDGPLPLSVNTSWTTYVGFTEERRGVCEAEGGAHTAGAHTGGAHTGGAHTAGAAGDEQGGHGDRGRYLLCPLIIRGLRTVR